MTKYEKGKLVLFAIVALGMIIVFYNNGLNGRYVMHPNKGVLIDSRTGKIHAMKDLLVSLP